MSNCRAKKEKGCSIQEDDEQMFLPSDRLHPKPDTYMRERERECVTPAGNDERVFTEYWPVQPDLVVSDHSIDLEWRPGRDFPSPSHAFESQCLLHRRQRTNEPSIDRRTRKREDRRWRLQRSPLLFVLRRRFVRPTPVSVPERDKVDTACGYCVDYSVDYARDLLRRSCAELEEEMRLFCPSLNNFAERRERSFQVEGPTGLGTGHQIASK